MAESLKKFIQEIAGKKAPGPSTTFTVFHVFYALGANGAEASGKKHVSQETVRWRRSCSHDNKQAQKRRPD